MNRKIEIIWNSPTPGRVLKGEVHIIEGDGMMEMETVAEFIIEKRKHGQTLSAKSGRHMFKFSEEVYGLITTMADAYFQGVHRVSSICAWERKVS